jgi:hypothetical protein
MNNIIEFPDFENIRVLEVTISKLKRENKLLQMGLTLVSIATYFLILRAIFAEYYCASESD